MGRVRDGKALAAARELKERIYDFDWGEGVIISQMAVQSIWGRKWLYPAQLVRTNNQNQEDALVISTQ